MNSVLFSIVFVFLANLYQVETTKENEDAYEDFHANRESQFYCDKLKSCTGGPKVCGYDQYKPWLAEFEDICIMYKTNCEHSGRFYPVDQVVCDTRIKYDKEHENETFEVIHINPTSSNRPVLKSVGDATRKRLLVKLLFDDEYYRLFEAYHCYQEMACKRGGGWVCGAERGKHARFPDKCHLHGVNCRGQGAYWQISTAVCKPTVFYAEALTAYYGQAIVEFSTTERPSSRRRRQKQHKIASENSSLFTKIRESILSISANFSIHY